jgi:hypothetical protein
MMTITAAWGNIVATAESNDSSATSKNSISSTPSPFWIGIWTHISVGVAWPNDTVVFPSLMNSKSSGPAVQGQQLASTIFFDTACIDLTHAMSLNSGANSDPQGESQGRRDLLTAVPLPIMINAVTFRSKRLGSVISWMHNETLISDSNTVYSGLLKFTNTSSVSNGVIQ